MRPGLIIDVTAADRALLEAVVADRNSPQKHVWRAGIVLVAAEGLGAAFAAKVREIVGLYVDPPAHAMVLSIDEKSQIQALDHTPMKRGRAGTMAHDYKRNGTTTLVAALDVLDGKVVGRCMQRHRHQEFIRFLNARLEDRASCQGHARHPRQLRRPQAPEGDRLAHPPPRVTFHFTPTSASWLNAVER